MRFRDVAIHLNAAIFGADSLVAEHPPISEHTDIASDMWIGRLDNQIAKTIMDLCEPKVLGTSSIFRQYGHLYAFVHELPSTSDVHRWDDDRRLAIAVAFSRLIHPTSLGFRYAARIADDAAGKVIQAYPAEILGIGREGWVSPTNKRDWLTVAEGDTLKRLLAVDTISMEKRIFNALWYFDYAARTYYVDQRWTMICTGLESLVHTDPNRSTKEFKTRVPQMAQELGVSITQGEAKQAYELRCAIAHGESFLSGTSSPPPATHIALYDQIETILRRAIVESLLNPGFGDVFRDDDAIRKRWPS